MANFQLWKNAGTAVSGVGPCHTHTPIPTLDTPVNWKISSTEVQLIGLNTDVSLARLLICVSASSSTEHYSNPSSDMRSVSGDMMVARYSRY
jgi:hypothetical protein